MTLLCIIKKASEESSDPLYEIIYIAVPDDESCQVETRVPDWKAIEKVEELSPFLPIFKGCFNDEKTRMTAEDVITKIVEVQLKNRLPK